MKRKTWCYLWIFLGIIDLNINNSCKKENIKAPMVITTAVSQADTVVVIGGNITDPGGSAVTEKGVVWSINQNPTLESNNGFTSDGPGTGAFSSDLSNLTPDTRYYVRAYATNEAGTGYGLPVYFTTASGKASSMPTVSINWISPASLSALIVYSSVILDVGSVVTAKGVVWSTNQNPTFESNNGFTSDGPGAGDFYSELLYLTPYTKYYVRAYSTNSKGETTLSAQNDFTTDKTYIKFITTYATEITSTSATAGGEFTGMGLNGIIAKGVCWSTSPNPTITDSKTLDGSGGTGTYVSSITGLAPHTTYYIMAWATQKLVSPSYNFETPHGHKVTYITLTIYGCQTSFTTN